VAKLEEAVSDSQILLFLAASMALIVTPGQDMVYVMSRSLAQGARAGLLSAAGVSAGLLVHSVLAAVGSPRSCRPLGRCSSRSSSAVPRTWCISASSCCEPARPI
jgi:hypothetical protein